MGTRIIASIANVIARWALAISVCSVVVAFSPAQAAAINVGGRSIVVLQPEGYCWLDLNGSENLMAQQAADIYSRTGQELLVMFADCKELHALRSGKVYSFNRHGNITAFTNRSGKVVPTGKSRAEVLEANAASLAKSSGRSLDSVLQMANKTLPGTITEFSAPRLIHRDPNALYIAGLSHGRSSTGKNRIIANIAAFTVLNGIQANIVLYEEAKSEPFDFVPLLNRSKNLVAELVRSNP